jgi:hypothetical protein
MGCVREPKISVCLRCDSRSNVRSVSSALLAVESVREANINKDLDRLNLLALVGSFFQVRDDYQNLKAAKLGKQISPFIYLTSDNELLNSSEYRTGLHALLLALKCHLLWIAMQECSQQVELPFISLYKSDNLLSPTPFTIG